MGNVCAASCLCLEGSPDPTVAEAMGARCALEFGRDLGFQNIILEGDSKTVIQAIVGRDRWCKFGQVIEDIHVIMAGFRSWRAEHVKREANEAAHGLARAVRTTGVSRIWIEKVPDIVQHIVLLEQLSLGVLEPRALDI